MAVNASTTVFTKEHLLQKSSTPLIHAQSTGPQSVELSIVLCTAETTNILLASAPCLSLQCGHVQSTQIKSRKILEEFVLLHPEGAVVTVLRLADGLYLRMLIPAWSIICPLARFKLAFAPRIAHLDQIHFIISFVVQTFHNCISMTLDNAFNICLVGALCRAHSHDVVCIIPLAESIKEIFFIQSHVTITTTTYLWPLHRPKCLKSFMRRIVQLFPLIFVWVVGSETFKALLMPLECVYVLATQE
mmetsp:Transcript_79311/g.144759  ORF Transcript_79311/g.144759 Transcript_79311/m.144759 type:complete len:246 (-) Transcript_79311:1357-2094(-)